MEHLSGSPGQDVSGCLAIVLMAKDLERLGDHCRNIYELASKSHRPVHALPGYEALGQAAAALRLTDEDAGRA